MMITTRTTVSFKLPEEIDLALKFQETCEPKVWYKFWRPFLPFLKFIKEETVHIKVKEDCVGFSDNE